MSEIDSRRSRPRASEAGEWNGRSGGDDDAGGGAARINRCAGVR